MTENAKNPTAQNTNDSRVKGIGPNEAAPSSSDKEGRGSDPNDEKGFGASLPAVHEVHRDGSHWSGRGRKPNDDAGGGVTDGGNGGDGSGNGIAELRQEINGGTDFEKPLSSSDSNAAFRHGRSGQKP